MENSTFISDSELTGLVNRSMAELYDLIIENYGEDYYISSATTPLVSGTDAYALPADFYKLVGVDLVISSTNKIPMKRFEFFERNNQNYSAAFFDQVYRYRLRGSNLVFSPIPNTTNSFTLWYVPLPTQLVNDSDTLQGFNGWEEYIIVDAAIKMRIKEETDTTQLMQQKIDLIERLKKITDNRDAAFPTRVIDTETYGNRYGRRWP
jgi:hypothetical protein